MKKFVIEKPKFPEMIFNFFLEVSQGPMALKSNNISAGAGAASDQQCSAVDTQSLAKIMDIAFLASFKAAYFGTSHNPLTAPRKYVIVL